MINKHREKFIKDYDEVIRKVATTNNVDLGVGADMFICTLKGKFGETFTDGAGTHPFEAYGGIPEGFDYDKAYKEYQHMLKKIAGKE